MDIQELELWLEGEMLKAKHEAAENEKHRDTEPHNRLYWYAVSRVETLTDIQAFIQRQRRATKRMRRGY